MSALSSYHHPGSQEDGKDVGGWIRWIVAMKTRDDDGGENPVSDERMTMMGMKTRKQRGNGDSSSTDCP